MKFQKLRSLINFEVFLLVSFVNEELGISWEQELGVWVALVIFLFQKV